LSELLPHTADLDDLCIVKTVNTEAINHDPAITFIQTGFQQPGRPCMGAWLSYGLGSANQNLPAFVVIFRAARTAISRSTPAVERRLLPSEYQGSVRGKGDPVLYLSTRPASARKDAAHAHGLAG